MEGQIRKCDDRDVPRILEIINAAAQRYRGAIPDDCWREPYMPAEELAHERAAGVRFLGVETDGRLIGVMGVQQVRDVHLIRHAYVLPSEQGRGVGSRLLKAFLARTPRPLLIGTWADATWAIGFYRRHGFDLASPEATRALLATYWDVPARQAEVSVVLTLPDAT